MFRILTGIVVFCAGLYLLYIGSREVFTATIPGLIVSGIGIAILLNKKEDAIEEIDNNKHS